MGVLPSSDSLVGSEGRVWDMGWVCVIESCFTGTLGPADLRGGFSSSCGGWGMDISIPVVTSGHGHVS